MSTGVEQAVRNVAMDLLWSDPNEDRQKVIRLSRLTLPRGTKDILSLPFIKIPKPLAGERFIYYSLGVTWPKSLGIEDHDFSTWQKVSQVVKGEDMIVFPYINERIIPLSKLWMRRTVEGNMFFALEIDNLEKHFDFSHDLIIRFYSNAWLTTEAGRNSAQLETLTGVIDDDLTGSAFSTAYSSYLSRPEGGVIAFKNGYYTDNPNSPNVVPGDVISLYYDSTIDQTVDIDVDKLYYFFSALDEDRRKALVSLPEANRKGQHWVDDIEVFIVQQQSEVIPFNKGGYYPSHNAYDIRNITPGDFSFDEESLKDSIEKYDFLTDSTEIKIRLILRKPDRSELVLQDGTNLNDFFLIPFEDRLDILKGNRPELNMWSASVLESSEVIDFSFTSKPWTHPLKNVFNFYGNAAISEQPFEVTAGVFRIPPVMRDGGILLEFDSTGMLLNIRDWYANNNSHRYTPASNVAMMRCVPGTKISTAVDLDFFSDFNDDAISEWYQERYYRTIGNDNWTLASNGVEFNLVDGLVQWEPPYLSLIRVKRTANSFIHRSLVMDSLEIGLPIDIFADRSSTTTGLGFGHYYAFLNNHMLVEGIDFQVIGLEIYILNQEYVLPDNDNYIEIIGHGCPHFNEKTISGFVERRTIPTKEGFNPVLNRNRDFIIDGKLRRESEIVFDSGYRSFNNPNTELPANVREGAVFGIEDQTNHMGLSDIEAVSETQLMAIERDQVLKEELAEYFPTPDQSGLPPVVIGKKHSIISIVLRTLLDELITGRLIISNQNLSPLAVNVLMTPYRHLLQYDICTQAVEHTYIEVAAHAGGDYVDLSVSQHQFLDQVNKLFLNNRCVLPAYFTF